MAAFRRLETDATLTAEQKLAPGGWFAMEFGYGQEEDVRRLIAARPRLRLERIRDDLQGIPRTVIARKADIFSV